MSKIEELKALLDKKGFECYLDTEYLSIRYKGFPQRVFFDIEDSIFTAEDIYNRILSIFMGLTLYLY